MSVRTIEQLDICFAGLGGELEVWPYEDETIVGVVPEAFRFLDSDIYVPLVKPGGRTSQWRGCGPV
jgi:hypothetical protein